MKDYPESPRSGDQMRCSALRKFTHDEYETLCRNGLIHPNERLELIKGEIREKHEITPQHNFATSELRYLIESQLPQETRGVFSCGLIRLGESSPEPDLFVTKGSRRGFGHRYPEADVLLIVELADVSLAFDRGEKLSLYAAAAIPVYWIVNLVDRQIEVVTKPSVNAEPIARYECWKIFKDGQSVQFETEISSAVISVTDILVRLE